MSKYIKKITCKEQEIFMGDSETNLYSHDRAYFNQYERAERIDGSVEFRSTPYNLNVSGFKTKSFANLSRASKVPISSQELTEARNKRRIIENNLKLLSTRVNILDNEKEKLQRNAHEMKIKAKHLLDLRLTNETQRIEQEMRMKNAKELRKKQTELLRQSINETRKKQRDELQKIKEAIQAQKKQDYLEIKSTQKNNETRIMKEYRLNVEHQRKRSEKVKYDYEKGQQRIEMFHNSKLEQLKEEKLDEFISEQKVIMERERQLSRLNETEDQKLNALGKAHQELVLAAHEFDDIQTSPLTMIETKYGQKSSKKTAGSFFSPMSKFKPELSLASGPA